MFVSLDWLREFVAIPKNVNATALAQLITTRTAEIEHVIDPSKELEKIVIGKVLELSKHPDADKLTLVNVDVGESEAIRVVCGGINLKTGMLVAVALPGAIVKWHGKEIVEMKIAKVRGVESHGMICASEEIGLGECADGEIMDLSYLKAKPGTALAQALGLDIIFEFDNKSLTHRPDLWGHTGIAREISAITGYKFTEKKAKVTVPKAGKLPDIKVENPELCPRYMGLIIKNVKVGPSPEWLKQRLKATGHSVISNIVDVTNYVMEEVGQPLHAFDLANVNGGIVVRNAKKNEKIITLDGEEKTLDSSMLVIADHSKALALAGVMGGEYSGIHSDTEDILLESANFEPSNVRLTSMKLGLRTDSVQRFEKSLDPKYCKRALLRAAELILELCPDAKIAGPYGDIANFETYEPEIEVDIARINKKIGVEIPASDMAKILESLEFEIIKKVTDKSQSIKLKVPSFRATKDVDIEEDIVEEIARIHGYEKIPALLPDLPAKVPNENLSRKSEHLIREILAFACGMTEVYNYSFYSEKTLEKFGLPKEKHLKIQNPLSEEQSHLRVSLIPNLNACLTKAKQNEASATLFEIGRAYKENGSFMPEEKTALAGITGIEGAAGFFHLKEKLEKFFEIFGIENAEFITHQNTKSYMHPHQCAEIKFRGKSIGEIFTFHPALEEIGAAFELDFNAISSGRKTEIKYKAESKFPSIYFDISVLLDKRTQYADAEKALKKAAGPHLQKIELFDIFEGDKIPEDKKSLAFRLTLQSAEQTLTDADMNSAMQASWTALEKLGGKIRT